MSNTAATWFKRPELKRTAPRRGAANFYREATSDGRAIGGVPLDNSEAAAVAVVRMAYRVAEAQIDRSAQLARRLREAGDHAIGPSGGPEALDGTERVVFRAMMSVLEWLENAAAQPGNPPGWLAAAAGYSLQGSARPPAPPTPRAPQGAPPSAEAPEPGPARDPRAASAHFPVQIRHLGNERRPVRVSDWEYAGDAGTPATFPVKFYGVDRSSKKALAAKVALSGRGSVTLMLATSPSTPAGRWRAALCDPDGVQVGRIEIML